MTQAGETATITGLVPMIHVADMDRSVAFYRLLGFEVGNAVPRSGAWHWAWLYAPRVADWKRGPNLMLTRDECAIEPSEQAILFYLYASNLKSLRTDLLAAGVTAGEIRFPDYLPNGEFRLQDPDGYVLMVAQSAADTP